MLVVWKGWQLLFVSWKKERGKFTIKKRNLHTFALWVHWHIPYQYCQLYQYLGEILKSGMFYCFILFVFKYSCMSGENCQAKNNLLHISEHCLQHRPEFCQTKFHLGKKMREKSVPLQSWLPRSLGSILWKIRYGHHPNTELVVWRKHPQWGSALRESCIHMHLSHQNQTCRGWVISSPHDGLGDLQHAQPPFHPPDRTGTIHSTRGCYCKGRKRRGDTLPPLSYSVLEHLQERCRLLNSATEEAWFLQIEVLRLIDTAL